MNSWLFSLQVIPLIFSLMETAEKLLGAGAGVKKKAFVKDGIDQTIKAIATISTGGQKETWQTLSLFIDPVSDVIDNLAALLFPKEK